MSMGNLSQTPGQLLRLLADLRADAEVGQLPDAAWDELAAIVFAGKLTFSGYQKFLAKHGITIGRGNISVQKSRFNGVAERLGMVSHSIDELAKRDPKKDLRALGAVVTDMALALGSPQDPAAQKMLLDSVGALTGVVGADVADKRVTQQGAALKLATDKFQFDATKQALAMLPQLRKVAADKSLDDRGRIDAARRILFGELPGEATK